MSVPLLARLGIPFDDDLLAGFKPADIRLVKIRSHALARQVGQLQKQFALLGEFGARYIHAIHSSGHVGADDRLRHHLAGCGKAGFGIGNRCLRTRHFLRRVAIAGTLLGCMQARFRSLHTLARRAHLAG